LVTWLQSLLALVNNRLPQSHATSSDVVING
jgi:hypothetical protein